MTSDLGKEDKAFVKYLSASLNAAEIDENSMWHFKSELIKKIRTEDSVNKISHAWRWAFLSVSTLSIIIFIATVFLNVGSLNINNGNNTLNQATDGTIEDNTDETDETAQTPDNLTPTQDNPTDTNPAETSVALIDSTLVYLDSTLTQLESDQDNYRDDLFVADFADLL